MGNSISADTDYRVSGAELIEIHSALGNASHDLSGLAQLMSETLDGITASSESITRAIAKFGVLTVRAMAMSRDYNRSLYNVAYKLAHTPIAKEDDNG